MASEGKGDTYWQKGQEDMVSLIDRTVKDQGKAEQVKSVVSEIVVELKASREQARVEHHETEAYLKQYVEVAGGASPPAWP